MLYLTCIYIYIYINPILLHLFNRDFSEGIFPDILKYQ